MNAEKMREILNLTVHPLTKVLPIPIEQVCTQSKLYLEAHCKYSIKSLHAKINTALNSIVVENIEGHFREVKDYMIVSLEGIPEGSNLELLVKNYRTTIMFHIRISKHQHNNLHGETQFNIFHINKS